MRRTCFRASLCLAVVWVVLVGSVPAGAADHPLPPAGEAMQYPAVDNHPAEHVAIAADPFNTPDKAAIFHINYSRYDVLPIRIIVTNNGDAPISLTEARIDFITAAGDKIPAAEPEDVERILSRPSDLKSGVKVGPLTFGKHKSQNKVIEEDFSRYEYAAIAVEAHTTRAGFLFYNLQNLKNPLVGGRLELRKLRAANGHELFAFEIPFDKYLSAPAPAAAPIQKAR